MDIRFKIDTAGARRDFDRAETVMVRNVERYQSRGAEELAREARDRAPKAFSTLANSIRAYRVGEMHWRVSTGVNYAKAVEEGTPPGTMPNPTHLYAWIKQRSGIGFSSTRPRSAGRRSQYAEIRSRAFALARHIKHHGTRPQPYMEPARAAKESRILALMRQGVDAGRREAFGS